MPSTIIVHTAENYSALTAADLQHIARMSVLCINAKDVSKVLAFNA
jgi:hypothetical protein